MGALTAGIGGNYSGALGALVPGLQPLMPLFSALEKRLKKDGRDQLQTEDIVKVHIVKDDSTRLLAISQSQMIRGGLSGLGGMNTVRSASMAAGVS